MAVNTGGNSLRHDNRHTARSLYAWLRSVCCGVPMEDTILAARRLTGVTAPLSWRVEADVMERLCDHARAACLLEVRVDVGDYQRLGYSLLQALAMHCPLLETLQRITRRDAAGPADRPDGYAPPRQDDAVYDGMLLSMAECCPRLQVLLLDGCPNVHDEAFIGLRLRLPRLRRLQICGSAVTAYGVQQLAHCGCRNELEPVELSQYWAEAADTPQQLELLDLSQSPQLAADTRLVFQTRFPRLQRLVLQGMRRAFGAERVATLCESCEVELSVDWAAPPPPSDGGNGATSSIKHTH